MELAPLIRDLAVILCVAGVVSFLFHKIRQPVVLGYLIAGMIVGPHTPPFPLVRDLPSIQIWAELGVIFLMFSLGLEFSFRKLTAVGISPGITACFEVLVMLCLGFGTGRLMGWSPMNSIFLGAMLSISSTTIIVRTLNEFNLKTRRFAEMIFAVLIVEDLAAILVLVALSTFAAHRAISGLVILYSLIKLILVVGSWFLAGYFLIPRFVRFIGREGTNEMLTLISLGLCLALAVLAVQFHYSAALGAFIMGSILAESTESQRIEERLESLRDLFAAVFFVSVGMLMNPAIIVKNLGPILLITVVTVIGKVLSTTLGALLTGQTIRTSIQVGFGLAQIGEFSFIIAGLGHTLGVTSDFLYPVGVAVSVITTFLTPYMIRSSHRIAVAVEDKLPAPIKGALTQFASWVQERQSDTREKQNLKQFLVPWGLNGLTVSVIFVISQHVVLPFVVGKWGQSLWVDAGVWFFTALVSSPFIWGMWSALIRFAEGKIQGDHLLFRQMKGEQAPPLFNEISASIARLGILVFFQFLSLLWLGALSMGFLPLRYVIIVIGLLVTALMIFFYRHLEFFYRWFERNFLVTFQTTHKTHPPVDLLKHLAPWDAHLVRIKVHPNADVVRKRLVDTQLRTRFGLNIVVIQRGLNTIIAPKPSEVILPGDELLVLATDEQLETSRAYLEKPSQLVLTSKPIANYTMRQARVDVNSPLLGKTIRHTHMREQYGGMVVGMQRGDRRIINPDSDLTLKEGDLLWIVGERDQLDLLISELFKSKEESAEISEPVF